MRHKNGVLRNIDKATVNLIVAQIPAIKLITGAFRFDRNGGYRSKFLNGLCSFGAIFI